MAALDGLIHLGNDDDLTERLGHALAHLGLGLEGQRPHLAAAVVVEGVIVVVGAVGGAADGGDKAKAVAGDTVRLAGKLGVVAGPEGLVATQHKFLVVRSNDELHEAGVGQCHLGVEPGFVAVEISAAAGDGGVHRGEDLIVKLLGTAVSALVQKAPDVTLEGGSGGGLPGGVAEGGVAVQGGVVGEGGGAAGFVEVTANFTGGIVSGGDEDVQLALMQGGKHGLVSELDTGGADVPAAAGDLAKADVDEVVVFDAQVGGVLLGSEVAEGEVDGGTVIVPLDQGRGETGGGGGDSGLAPEVGDE